MAMDSRPSRGGKGPLGGGLLMGLVHLGLPGWSLVAGGLTAYGVWRLAGNRVGTWVVVVLSGMVAALSLTAEAAKAGAWALPVTWQALDGAAFFLIWPAISLVGFGLASSRGLAEQERALAWAAVGWLVFLAVHGSAMAVLRSLAVTGAWGVGAAAAFACLAIVTFVEFPGPADAEAPNAIAGVGVPA